MWLSDIDGGWARSAAAALEDERLRGIDERRNRGKREGTDEREHT